MAFTRYTPSSRPGGNLPAQGVRIRRSSTDSHYLIIAADLIADLGNPKYAWPSIGHGSDAGKLLISAAAKGYKVRPGDGGSVHVFMVIVPKALIVRPPEHSTQVRHEMTDDGLVVDLSDFILPAPASAKPALAA